MFELPILTYTSCHAELIMLDAHLQDHKSTKTTLWRYRSKAWIWQGAKLARKIARGVCTAAPRLPNSVSSGQLDWGPDTTGSGSGPLQARPLQVGTT